MKRNAIVAAVFLLAFGVMIFWIIRQRSKGNLIEPLKQATSAVRPADSAPPKHSLDATTPLPSVDGTRRAVEIVEAIYSAPISFYGLVKDQSGAPVSQARVDYSIIDKFFETGSKSTGVSDEQGSFALTGVNGAALTVGVSKHGYSPIYGQSNGSFAYGMPFDAERNRPTPTKDNPAIFILRKKTEAESVFVVDRDVKIPKDGNPVEINLRTGKLVPLGQGDLKIECWTSDEAKDANRHYEWHARISIPDGGIMARTNTESDFTAPEKGYEPAIEIAMPQASTEWRRDHDVNYWVSLRDHTYARIRLRIMTAGDHFVTITSYLNPSGSRNLEFDENKMIR